MSVVDNKLKTVIHNTTQIFTCLCVMVY